MDKQELKTGQQITSYRDPYPKFLETAERVADFNELAARHLIDFNPYQELSMSTHRIYENLYHRWGFNYNNVCYLLVDQDLEKYYPHLKFANSWAKFVVNDSLDERLPIQMRTQVLIFLRENNQNDRRLIIHELAHPLADAVSEQVEIIRHPVMAGDNSDLNPRLFQGMEITLWEDVFREGLAILFEPEDTLIADDPIAVVNEHGWGEMTIFDFLLKVKAKDKTSNHVDPAIQIRKIISAALTADQITCFGNINEYQVDLDEPAVWNLPRQLCGRGEEQQNWYRATMSLHVGEFVRRRATGFEQRKGIVLNPTLEQIGQCAPQYPWVN